MTIAMKKTPMVRIPLKSLMSKTRKTRKTKTIRVERLCLAQKPPYCASAQSINKDAELTRVRKFQPARVASRTIRSNKGPSLNTVFLDVFL